MKRSSCKKANYGIYSMNYVIIYVLLGIALMVLCVIDYTPFIIYVLITLYMFWAIKKRRFIECEKLLNIVQIRNDDTVLNIGCGRGLADEKIKWHPAFAAAVKLKLKEYRKYLEFIGEYQLTDEPLRIDVLVVKKLREISMDKFLGRIFKKYNILEY